MNSSDLLNGLNPEQREAARAIDGPVLVLAGAGTGKTRVITFRIAHMIESGIEPSKILGMTFTNKAAKEMRERLASLTAPEMAKKVTLGTFHSFCSKFLRREIGVLGYLPNFTIADDQDQQGLVKQSLALAGIGKEQLPTAAAMSYIGKQKNRFLFPPEADRKNRFDAACALVYTHYQQLLELQNCVDFDDLLLLTCKILRDFPEIRAKYQAHYQYLLIDEYQDTNDVQFEIVRMLCENHHNLCVVGDDDQSIYSWRGANISNILDFPTRFPATKQVKLEQNYRSTNTILQAANRILSKQGTNFAKNLWSNQGAGEQIQLVRADGGEEEADFVAGYIAQLMMDNPEFKYSDFAILYRSNHLSRQLEIGLRRSGIPYRLVGGQEFYQRKEIKDAAAYLKIIANPRDNQSLLRILPLPPRGLADKAVGLLKSGCSKNKSMRQIMAEESFYSQLLTKGATAARELNAVFEEYTKAFAEPGNLAGKVIAFLNDVNYVPGLQQIYKDIEDARKRRENIDEFINSVAQFEAKNPEQATLSGFLENFALLEDNDRTEEPENNAPSVTLSTIHASKGLEFPVVFLVAMEEETFPHERAIEEGNIEEEMRLFYVAVTRAKTRLIITAAKRRMVRGVGKDRRTSHFIRRLPEELCEASAADDLVRNLTKDELTKQFENIFNLLR